jgi:HNH endonuclease
MGRRSEASLWYRVVIKIRVGDDGCWYWMGALNNKGYAMVGLSGKGVLVHKALYERGVGPVPDGYELDHLCRHRSCVCPGHLEPVTHTENMRRSPLVGRNQNTDKRYCKRGHEFTEANTRIKLDGSRACRICQREQGYKDFLRRKERGYIYPKKGA